MSKYPKTVTLFYYAPGRWGEKSSVHRGDNGVSYTRTDVVALERARMEASRAVLMQGLAFLARNSIPWEKRSDTPLPTWIKELVKSADKAALNI